jgi:transitional endoplasmic reticulum ATPase
MRFLDHLNNDDDTSRQTVELLVPYEHYVKFLMLKALLELRGLNSWLSTRNAPEMLGFLGVSIDLDDDDAPEDFSDDLILKMKYRRRLEALLKDKRDTTMPMNSALVKNAQRIKERFGLTDTEMRILVVAVLTKNDSRLNSALNAIGTLTDQGVFSVLGGLLDTRETQIERSLSQSGRLFGTGLVRLDSSGAYSLALKLDLLPAIKERFLRVTDDSNLLELFSASFAAARPASLALKDFDYLNPLLGYVVDLLRDALQQGSPGVNIFLSGPPGVGKTQMVLAIAEAIEAPLYEVAITQRDGGERLDGAERLSAYSATQSILAGQRAVAMIDEADDIFGTCGIQFGGRSGVPKAWLNRQLETNPVPAIWISNSSEEFDAAHLRRFALHVKVDIPPAAARARILDAYAAPLKISREWSASFARGSNASPAMIAQAATVTQAVVRSRGRRKGVRKGVTDIFQQVLSNNMSALGQTPLQSITQSTDFYDPSLLCCKGIDPMKLVQGLRGSPNGRLLFFGAPGTGKSALGIHIAEALGRPAIVKTVADIQSPYVGVAEKNIAKAFQEALDLGAVPIFDEADSYLSNRADAHRQHEVTLVNEFLMQLEKFHEGIVIATTNRLDQLDAAALRRFDLKVEFGWLQREQRRLLFKQRCETLGIYEPGVEDLVNDVDNLAPGDVEAVVRGSRFNPMSSAQDFATRLRAEVSLKPGAKRSGPIGFVH